jgi:hypothetical protein
MIQDEENLIKRTKLYTELNEKLTNLKKNCYRKYIKKDTNLQDKKTISE